MPKWSEDNIQKIVGIMHDGGTIRQILDALKPAFRTDPFGFHDMEVGKDYFFPDAEPKPVRDTAYRWNASFKDRHYKANLVKGVIRVRREK